MAVCLSGDGAKRGPDFSPSLGTSGFLAFWTVLLLPWMVLTPLAGMAFDGGETLGAYVFFWSFLTYPIALAAAAFFRKWTPWAVLLPFVNFVAVLNT